MMGGTCRLCDMQDEQRLAGNESFFAVYDRYPVNRGHCLVISKRHISDLFELTEDEFIHLRSVIHSLKKLLDDEYSPDGYNIGANCGQAAGQTLDHFHLHIIPRYVDDVADPRGGVRNIKEPLVPYLEEIVANA